MAKRVELLWDRDQIINELDITKKEFVRLSRSPAFPSPSVETRFEIKWHARDILDFQRRMDDCRRKGWLVPEALFAWSDTGERETSLI